MVVPQELSIRQCVYTRLGSIRFTFLDQDDELGTGSSGCQAHRQGRGAVGDNAFSRYVSLEVFADDSTRIPIRLTTTRCRSKS